jgi:uncharacterized protein (TIGR03435 family)
MSRVVAGIGLLAMALGFAEAQTEEAPAFEVASIKQAAPQPAGMLRVMMRGGPGSPDPGQVTYTNVTLKNVLMNAYDVKGYQIQGPGWLDSERYDIMAKVPKGATKEQFRLMLQNLVAERFKVALHRETKEMPVYSLVVGKNGPKMKESVEDPAPKDGAGPEGGPAGAGPGYAPRPLEGHEPVVSGRIPLGKDGMPQLPPGAPKGTMMMMMNGGRFRMNASGQTTAGLVNMLANQLGRPVIDNTGLTGKYDFTLDFAPEEGGRMPGPMGAMPMPAPSHAGEGGAGGGGGALASTPEAQTGPSLFTAVQEQLGLKLEQKKGPVELLVIDRAEKVPTEN